MLLCCVDYLKRNSKMKNNEQHIMPFIERLLDGAEVEWKPLGDVADIYGGLTGKSKSDFEHGNALFVSYKNIYNNYEVNSQELSKVKVSETEQQHKIEYGDILFTGSSETAEEVAYSSAVTTHFNEAVYLNSFSFGVRFHKDIELIPEFSKHLFRVSYMRKQLAKTASGVTRFNVSKTRFKKILIPIPPLSVQRKLVEILDKFTELEAELEAELDCRKRQYEYYRNKLLAFDMLNTPEKLNNVITMSLGEVGTFTRGSGLQKKDFTPTGVGCIHYGQIYTYYGTYAYKTKSFVSQKFAQKARKAKYGDLIIATTSENDEDVCKAVVWLGNEDIAVSSDACFYIHKMNPKYVAYYFQTEQFQKQKRKFITGAKVRRVNATDLAKIKIPIPPLSEQQRIVSFLDKFDTLTSSISEGLPKEIELRRKQYEYYREQLLSFRH